MDEMSASAGGFRLWLRTEDRKSAGTVRLYGRAAERLRKWALARGKGS